MSITQFDDHLPQTNDFKSIVLNQTPLIDVRAPIEFEQGAFETAINLPLMNNEERQQVGACYKQQGHEQAVALGHQRLTPALRAERIEAWQHFIQTHPQALLYCFRGGMRSKIAQQWLKDEGITITRLTGGYKAFRRTLLHQIETLSEQLNADAPTESLLTSWVITGPTGSGKTLAIEQLANAIDLEKLAHHRGSTFGGFPTAQPTQINFENQLAMHIMRLLNKDVRQFIVEDESANIGSINIPKPLYSALKKGRLIEIDVPFEQRLQLTHQEYVVLTQQRYDNLTAWETFMEAAINRIRKRLGGERHQRVASQFQQACKHQQQTGQTDYHFGWIRILLAEYYDPMYDYQKQKKRQSIAFKGSLEDVVTFLKTDPD